MGDEGKKRRGKRATLTTLAQGTSDQEKAARKALDAVMNPVRPLPQRILQECLEEAHTSAQLAELLEVPLPETEAAIKMLYAAGTLANIGTEKRPRWFVRVGDDAPNDALEASIRYLISDRPMTMPELEEFTGARSTRVTGARIQLIRDGHRIANFGNGRFAKWWLIPAEFVVEVQAGEKVRELAAHNIVTPPTGAKHKR